MPLFDYRCSACLALTEALVRPGSSAPVECRQCGSMSTARIFSPFAIKLARAAKYDEKFRERTLPFLKSRPETRQVFAEGGQSDEAKAFALTEKIGARVDTILDQQVFAKLKR